MAFVVPAPALPAVHSVAASSTVVSTATSSAAASNVRAVTRTQLGCKPTTTVLVSGMRRMAGSPVQSFVVLREFSTSRRQPPGLTVLNAANRPDLELPAPAAAAAERLIEERKQAVAAEGRRALTTRRARAPRHVPVEGMPSRSLIEVPMKRPAEVLLAAEGEFMSERDTMVLHGLGIDGEVRRVQHLIGPWKSPESHPALVLNTDFRPLSYLPLSLWSWQDAVKATFLNRVTIVSEYDRTVRSPNFEMRIPSVVALKEYVRVSTRPAFTRYNVFLRDRFCCQYCSKRFRPSELSFDHVVPRCKGGKHTWENVVASCHHCNARKGGRMPKDSGYTPIQTPYTPSIYDLQERAREYLPTRIHESWRSYL